MVAFDEVDVTCADDLKKETKLRCIYSGNSDECLWCSEEWYMNCSVVVKTKPKTITVNGFEVPEPVREELKCGGSYYVPNVITDGLWAISTWKGVDRDYRNLDRSLIHLTKESAIAHAKAMLGINPNDVSN